MRVPIALLTKSPDSRSSPIATLKGTLITTLAVSLQEPAKGSYTQTYSLCTPKTKRKRKSEQATVVGLGFCRFGPKPRP